MPAVFILILGVFFATLFDFHLPAVSSFTDPEARSTIDGNMTRLNNLLSALAGITAILFAVFHSIKKDEEFLLVLFRETFFFPILGYYSGVIISLKLSSDFFLKYQWDGNVWARVSILSTYGYMLAVLFLAFIFVRLVITLSSGRIMQKYYDTFIDVINPQNDRARATQRRKRASLLSNLSEAISSKDIHKLERLMDVYEKIIDLNPASLVAGNPSRTILNLFELAIESRNKDAAYLLIARVAEVMKTRNRDLQNSFSGILPQFYKIINANKFDVKNLTTRVSEVARIRYRSLSV
ncbi:MAG: hypothetical protein Q8919_05730 [Bacteroidota bacterium]|nr:hypothetical protein [Bacteroidota bacterium]